MKNIYLVGFMATGKTEVGRILAEKLGREFIEMDEVIQQREGSRIVDIFAHKSESYFRQLEKSLLKEFSRKKNFVISCGGGLICNSENLALLKETGIIFTLRACAQTIYARAKKYSHRPMLNVKNPLKTIEELLNKRTYYYDQADHIIDTEDMSPEAVADKIRKIIENG